MKYKSNTGFSGPDQNTEHRMQTARSKLFLKKLNVEVDMEYRIVEVL